MSSKIHRLISTLSVVLLIIIAMIVPRFVGSVQQEQQERLIEKESWRNEPIKIVKLKTKGKDIELGKKFLEEDDWLRGLTANVRNITDKPISHIELHLSFLQPKGTDSEKAPEFVTSMIYGKEPSPDVEDQKWVLPGEIVEIKLLEANLPLIKTALKNLGFPEKITHVRITVDTVTFNDGSTWANGKILYPDPDNPGVKRDLRIPKPFKLLLHQSALPDKSPPVYFRNALFRVDAPSTPSV